MSRHVGRLPLLLAALSAIAIAQAGPTAPKLPGFVRLHLAGGKLADKASYVKHDPVEGYYLIATGDCDGASIDMVLTPDPKPWGIDPEHPEESRIQRVRLPRLRTGTGVNIGGTPAQVKRKLGRSPHQEVYHRPAKERVWTYRAMVTVRARNGREDYTATYTFRNERLRQIHYNIGSGHG